MFWSAFKCVRIYEILPVIIRKVTMKPLAKLLKKAQEEGWKSERTKRHIMLKHPSGATVTVSVSASDYNAFRNMQADMKRELRRCNESKDNFAKQSSKLNTHP